jgi:hypothetical protein
LRLSFLSISLYYTRFLAFLICLNPQPIALRVELDSPRPFHLIASSQFSPLFLEVCKFASLRVFHCEKSFVASRSHKCSIIRNSDAESNIAHDPMLDLLCPSTALLLEEKKV